uniref:RNA-binding protein 20-like n=1 Tax=Fundulus heteroclitus TaxID=8078 RepID=A0A3Q2PNA1_FUNHE
MRKMQKKKLALGTSTNLKRATHRLAVHKDSNALLLAPTLCSEHSAALSITRPTRGSHFIFGPAIAALRLAQIETQTQIALRHIAVLASLLSGCQCDLTAVLPPHLALLSLFTRQQASTLGLEVTTSRRVSATTQLRQSAAMYRQQQGSQPFPNAPRPHHQPAASQHPNHHNMQVMGFQFPRPNQLPDELESALAIRGSRDMDHRQIDHRNQPNQHQNQGSVTGIGQHGSYGSNPGLLSAENQPGHQQGVDWSSYQPPAKLFAQTQQQQPQRSQEVARIPNWNRPINDSPSPQTRQSLGDGSRVEGQGLYTPESAGSILASFGLSNDDLEVLSHYPDDQLTPDTLPFILRDIQLNKSGKKTAGTSSSSYSHNVAPRSSHSPEVPSLLTVTQTAGKVIDYGHASRGTEESGTRETFKREPLSSGSTVKVFSTTASSVSKVDKTERRQVHLEHKEASKHGDRDYRRTSCEKRKNSRSPARQFAPLPKSRNLDRDYRQVESRPRSSSETRSDSSSRRSLSASRQHGSSKKLPTPTMISDFAAMSPKVYPHTCSLCHIQCDQEKDWVAHINTVDHTVACRDLRNKYPDWKPNHPSRSGRYGNRALWDPKDGCSVESLSRAAVSCPSSKDKYRREPYIHQPHGRAYSPHRHSRPSYHTERNHRFEHHHHRAPLPSRESWPEERNRESSGGYSHRGVKRPGDAVTKDTADTSRNPSSSAAGHGTKHGPPKGLAKGTKAAPKPAVKTTKTACKSLPVKKKKKAAAPPSQGLSFADRLVYLTGIPVDATEQEVTDLVSSFGKINNVILLPCSEGESEKDQGQKAGFSASVCMMRTEDAKALASASKLCIRDQAITASVGKKPEDGLLLHANSKADAEKDKESAGKNSGGETDQNTSDQQWKVLISGLPDSGWSERDIIQFVQSFGTPTDIILAMHIGKALVSFPDLDVAEEIVKVHSFKPAMFQDTQVKMSLVKQQIGLSTPVALYNLFMGSLDPLESPALVGWNSLVVIRNVPDTPAGSTEVLKLMRRFGTVIKSLVVNNMIICEMATTAMALSVYKRFLAFPCIIQNNPLVFYRKADPKAHPQDKVIPAYSETSEDKPADYSQAAAEPLKQDEDQREVPPEKSGDEKTNAEEQTEEEHLEKKSKDDSVQEEKLSVSVSSTVSDSKPDKDDAENVEVNKDVRASGLRSAEETEASSSSAKPAAGETAMSELPKMTQAMVNALLVECRTRTVNNLNKTAAPPSGEQVQVKQEKEDHGKPAVGAKDSTENTAEEKDEAKKQDRERKEREAKKEARKERERKERERKGRERGEKARKDVERREEERRDWERRRGCYERTSRSKSSYRPEGHRQSWRDERHRGEAERRKDQLEEDQSDDFPFNMSDFVTVDELGDVTDLPDAAVPMETSEKESMAFPAEQQEDHKDTSVGTTVTQEAESGEQVSESEHVSNPTPRPLNSPESDQDPNAAELPPAASHIQMAPIETGGPPEPAKDNVSTKPDTALASSPDVEPTSTCAAAVPAQSTSNSPAGAVTAESEERKSGPVPHGETPTEEPVEEPDTQVEQPPQNVEKTEEAPEKPVKAEDSTGEDCVKKPLPPYDPSKAVGMEYLVPKTGFFCKVCSRFFTGAKVAEISHCKTLKHYENLRVS